MVYVEKGGEIILKIVGVDKDVCIMIGDKVKFIIYCFECGSKLVCYEGEVVYYCINDVVCFLQIKGKIEYFISCRVMNIDGFGLEMVDQFYQEGLICDVVDLYILKILDIINLECMGEKFVENIIKGIEQFKEVLFERVFFVLGICFVGEIVVKKVVKFFKLMDVLVDVSLDNLIYVDEIGEKIVQSILLYFVNLKNCDIIECFCVVGVRLEVDEEDILEYIDKLVGKFIVISGVFVYYLCDEYKELIEKYGGKNVGSILFKISFILVGDNMGFSKLEKVQKLGVIIVSEEEFL